MPFRTVKPVSDRGSIRDLNKRTEESTSENPPIPFEARLAALYERAEKDNNMSLMDSLGFIVMNNPGDRSAFPVTLFRHREKVQAIAARYGRHLQEAVQELAPLFNRSGGEDLIPEIRIAARKREVSRQTILDSEMIKTASDISRRSFRRVP